MSDAVALSLVESSSPSTAATTRRLYVPAAAASVSQEIAAVVSSPAAMVLAVTDARGPASSGPSASNSDTSGLTAATLPSFSSVTVKSTVSPTTASVAEAVTDLTATSTDRSTRVTVSVLLSLAALSSPSVWASARRLCSPADAPSVSHVSVPELSPPTASAETVPESSAVVSAPWSSVTVVSAAASASPSFCTDTVKLTVSPITAVVLDALTDLTAMSGAGSGSSLTMLMKSADV